MCFVLVRHIKKTDGFIGLYRGLVPRLMSTCVNGVVSAVVADVRCSYLNLLSFSVLLFVYVRQSLILNVINVDILSLI